LASIGWHLSTTHNKQLFYFLKFWCFIKQNQRQMLSSSVLNIGKVSGGAMNAPFGAMNASVGASLVSELSSVLKRRGSVNLESGSAFMENSTPCVSKDVVLKRQSMPVVSVRKLSAVVGPAASVVGPAASVVGPSASVVGPSASVVGPSASVVGRPTTLPRRIVPTVTKAKLKFWSLVQLHYLSLRGCYFYFDVGVLSSSVVEDNIALPEKQKLYMECVKVLRRFLDAYEQDCVVASCAGASSVCDDEKIVLVGSRLLNDSVSLEERTPWFVKLFLYVDFCKALLFPETNEGIVKSLPTEGESTSKLLALRDYVLLARRIKSAVIKSAF
jgi:hypothetical protein